MIKIDEYKNMRWEAKMSVSFSFNEGKIEFDKDDKTSFSDDGVAKFEIDPKLWDSIKDKKELYMENRSKDAYVYHYDIDKISIKDNLVTLKFKKKTPLSKAEYRIKTIENFI